MAPPPFNVAPPMRMATPAPAFSICVLSSLSQMIQSMALTIWYNLFFSLLQNSIILILEKINLKKLYYEKVRFGNMLSNGHWSLALFEWHSSLMGFFFFSMHVRRLGLRIWLCRLGLSWRQIRFWKRRLWLLLLGSPVRYLACSIYSPF